MRLRSLARSLAAALSAAPLALALAVTPLALGGCAGAGSPAVPGAPAGGKGDNQVAEGYQVDGARRWHLVGDPLTPGHDTYAVTARVSEGDRKVHAWVNRKYAGSFTVQGGQAEVAVDIGSLAAGEHEVLLSADDSRYAFAQLFFVRSAPLYVVVSNDWDDADNADATLERQERLHERHPELKLTHFVGPYTFTDPSVSPERARFLVDWVTRLRDEQGDEIGLHIHPYCNFVEAAGLTCKTSPSFAYANGDATGYTVRLGVYSEEEFTTLLEKADELFIANGLGKPTSFRAGGWTLELHTLKALANAGHVADTSAVNWQRMEEWDGHSGATLYEWNQTQWGPIDETSQPYYPSDDDILSWERPHVPVLEVPDNGILVDYVTSDEMIEMFAANFSGEPLAEPRAYSIGYHPPNFSETLFGRMDRALDHIDRHLVSADGGPVVYARLSDLTKVWPLPE